MIKSFFDTLESLLGIDRKVSIPIVLTLSTFLLGFIINWTANAVIKWLKKRRYRTSLMVIINDFVHSCKAQEKINDKFTEQKGYLHGENYTLQIKSNFALNYLSKLDVASFIENFSRNFDSKRPEEICELFSLVENVRFQNEKLQEMMELTRQKYWEHADEYKKGLDGIRIIFDEFISEHREKKDVPKEVFDMVNPIGLIFKKWTDKGANKNIHNTHSEIVISVYNQTKTSKPHPYSTKLLNHCLDSMLAFDNIKNVEQVMKDEIAYSASVYKNAHDKIASIYNKWK